MVIQIWIFLTDAQTWYIGQNASYLNNSTLLVYALCMLFYLMSIRKLFLDKMQMDGNFVYTKIMHI